MKEGGRAAHVVFQAERTAQCNKLVAREITAGIWELKEVPEATTVYSNKKDQKQGTQV